MALFIDYLTSYLPGRRVRSLAGMTPRLVSVGYNCASKYQIARHLYFRLKPFGDMSGFVGALYRKSSQQKRGSKFIDFDANLFDWQVTPFSAVIECIRSDFQDIFDYSDLEINVLCNRVDNKRLRTQYAHAFRPSDEQLTWSDVEQQYPALREKADHLTAKFRKILQSNGPVVYVHFCSSQPPGPDQIQAFLDSVRAYNGRHAFRLALVGVEGRHAAPDLTPFGEDAGWHVVASCSKPDAAKWEEDDESWGRALAAMMRRPPRAPSPKRWL